LDCQLSVYQDVTVLLVFDFSFPQKILSFVVKVRLFSWERGANENMNGLIRQYLPKGSSFEDLTDEDISFIQNRLNNRPRKKLGFLTSLEYFFANFETITNGLTDKLHL